MKEPKIPRNEQKRLEALFEYSILDTLPEKEYDDITFLASHICDTPISLISLIDENRQWFKSRHGLNAEYTARKLAFCAHAINDKDKIFIIPDSRKDERFFDNPLVTSDPFVIFYAGVPLVSEGGYPIGTLCVIDNVPRNLSDHQIEALNALSRQLCRILDKRKQAMEIQQLNRKLSNQNKKLKEFAKVAAHDIKSPVNNIISVCKQIEDNDLEHLNDDLKTYLGIVDNASHQLSELIDGILNHSLETSKTNDDAYEYFDIYSLINEVIQVSDPLKEARINIKGPKPYPIFTHRNSLYRIILNLLSNSIKYNDKEQIEIDINIGDRKDYSIIRVCDNGPGIPEKDQKKVFELFQTSCNKSRCGQKGTGIGLATVKTLVENMGGSIELSSQTGEGCCFEISLKK